MLTATVIASLATVSFAASFLPAQEIVHNIIEANNGLFSSCPANSPPSCTNSTEIENLCCYEYPGGLLALTQFWDWSPSTGPEDSWTIHGLWPDNCDGTFAENCDRSRAYTGLTELLESQGASDTLQFMDNYWVDINGRNEQFWQHEWGKHGTCLSTLNPSCLPDGSPEGAEAVAFFRTVVDLFQQYDLYGSLAAKGITPDTRKTYTLSELQSAIQSAFGVKATFDCNHGKNLNQIYIFFHLKGSAIDGVFTPIDAPKRGSCPTKGIRYQPKH